MQISCQDKDVEFFLKEKAFDFEQRNLARTYLVLDDAEFSAGSIVILAYFTLSIKALQFSQSIQKQNPVLIKYLARNSFQKRIFPPKPS